MSTKVAARLDKSGKFYISNDVELDEITISDHRITSSKVYAGEFDEVSGTENNRVMQQKQTGKLIISGVFDEVTGIS
jgi:ligand-binding sensor protein